MKLQLSYKAHRGDIKAKEAAQQLVGAQTLYLVKDTKEK